MIFKESFFVDKPKATIIVVHGIAEHSARYKEVAEKLNKAYYDVVLYDHLGHGRSGGQKGKIKSFHNHIDVLHNIVLEQKARNNNKVFLLGHSMGGGIVNLYAVKYGDIDGIVSIAAATNTPKNLKLFRALGFWLLRWVPVSTKMFKNGLAKDPEVYLKTRQDPLMLKYIYVSLAGEMFIKGVKYLHNNIDNFKTPIIYLHGKDDPIVDYRFSEIMFDKIKVEDKEIKLYDGEYHEMLNDYNKDIIFNDILNWLEKR